jgi:hypothetical protein
MKLFSVVQLIFTTGLTVIAQKQAVTTGRGLWCTSHLACPAQARRTTSHCGRLLAAWEIPPFFKSMEMLGSTL